jgi:hypothetical protein
MGTLPGFDLLDPAHVRHPVLHRAMTDGDLAGTDIGLGRDKATVAPTIDSHDRAPNGVDQWFETAWQTTTQ